jgi:hypothetical protein
MIDDRLLELKTLWQGQEVNTDVLGRSLRRWRIRTYVAVALEMATALFAALAGARFIVVAFNNHDLLVGLSGIMLLVACPVVAVQLFAKRRQSFRWVDRTPEGTLRYALIRTHSIAAVLRIQILNCITLLCFVALLWLCVLLGWMHAQNSLSVLSLVWISWAVAIMIWTRRQQARNNRAQSSCQELIRKYEDAKRYEHS